MWRVLCATLILAGRAPRCCIATRLVAISDADGSFLDIDALAQDLLTGARDPELLITCMDCADFCLNTSFG
jgi:hypothetical protein